MGSPESPTGAQPSAPEQRTCRECSATKAVSPETWPYRNKGKGTPYQAHGLRCLDCEKKRKAVFDARRRSIASLVDELPSLPPGKGEDKSKQTEAIRSSKLDVAKALKAGARVLNEYAPSVLARVLEYADDPEHEHHLWALEILVQRILPRKLFEELGGQAAGIGSLEKQRPTYLIQVLPANADQPAGRVVEGEVKLLEVLPTK
jgi:hypothetical protein